jgi:DNA-binding response OmpR family regulator
MTIRVENPASKPGGDRRASAVPLGSVRAVGSVLVVGEPHDCTVDHLVELLGRRGWPHHVVSGVDRVRWVASVRRPVAILVVAAGQRWTADVVAAARAVTDAGLVVIGQLPPSTVVDLLDAGADCVTSGKAPDEVILARFLAVVRRASAVHDPGVRHLVSPPLEVDLWAQTATLAGEPLALSPTEYKLLIYLMRHAGRTIPSRNLIDGVWGWADGDGLNTLRIFVGRLRRKLGVEARSGKYISVVRGRGYRFDAPVVEQGDDRVTMVREQAQLLDAVGHIAAAAAQAGDEVAGAQNVVGFLVGQGATDAAAILRVYDGRLRLLAHAGLSPAWHAAIGPGIPLDTNYATVQSIERKEPVQLSQISMATTLRCPRTAALLRLEETEVGTFFPIMVQGRAWGSMGVLRRSSEPFSTATLAYFRAALAVYGAVVRPPQKQIAASATFRT